MRQAFISEEFKSKIQRLQEQFAPRIAKLQPVINSDFPELIVTAPDEWDSIELAPLYDVHKGSGEHDSELFDKHHEWIKKKPNVLWFNGGDMVENANPSSPGASVMVQKGTPNEQLYAAATDLADIQHKMLFAIPGNHEDRTFNVSGMDGAQTLAEFLRVPYYPDYAFVTIRWRGQNFRLLAHHGSGAAQTPGAQRNAARKDMPWAHFDIFWTGHLHQPMADVVYQIDHDQATGLAFERNAVVIISPSYVKYFGGYAAKKRMAPGNRGLTAVTLQPDGRIDVSLHARGRRL
jgi:hypothetical protein